MTLHSCFQPASLIPHPAPLHKQRQILYEYIDTFKILGFSKYNTFSHVDQKGRMTKDKLSQGSSNVCQNSELPCRRRMNLEFISATGLENSFVLFLSSCCWCSCCCCCYGSECPEQKKLPGFLWTAACNLKCFHNVYQWITSCILKRRRIYE